MRIQVEYRPTQVHVRGSQLCVAGRACHRLHVYPANLPNPPNPTFHPPDFVQRKVSETCTMFILGEVQFQTLITMRLLHFSQSPQAVRPRARVGTSLFRPQPFVQEAPNVIVRIPQRFSSLKQSLRGAKGLAASQVRVPRFIMSS